LAQSVAPGSSPSLVCRLHGISSGQLYTWRRQFRTGELTGFAPVRLAPPVDELPRAAASVDPVPTLPETDRPADGIIEVERFGRDASAINAHYGDDPGVKFYTHLSDRYAPFHTKVIAATASEAAHVLDGLLYHQSEVVAGRHHTDGGGDSDHVFALCSLLGFQFAPRIPDLKSRRLYSFV
jgi:hypothetical protein